MEMSPQHTGVLEEIPRAPLKAAVRRIGLENWVEERRTELLRQSEEAIIDHEEMEVVFDLILRAIQ